MRKDKARLEKQYSKFKSINLKLKSKIRNKDKVRKS